MPTSAEWTAAKQARRAERERQLAGKIMALPTEVFGVAYVDLPWRYGTWSEKGKDRAADNHYPTMTDAEIFAMADRIKTLMAPSSVLLMWATVPKLMIAGAIMQAWGFTYKSSFAWDKDKLAHGYWNRNQHEVLTLGTRGELDVPPELLWRFETRDGIELLHEYLLIGVRGKALPAPAPGTQYPSLIRARATRHSAKPEIFYEIIEHYFPNLPKIELFARGVARPGWTVWGNEAVSSVRPLAVPARPGLVAPDDRALFELYPLL
jgi:N6-adenosine-specific RNA methylase IME4